MLIGRDPEAGITPYADEAAYVSSRHAEIMASDGGYRLTDLGSTNGTLVNGSAVTEIELTDGDLIRFGSSGPEYRFDLTAPPALNLEATITSPPAAAGSQDSAGDTQAKIVDDAVRQARHARREGFGRTGVIMREMLDSALRRSQRKHRRVIVTLAILLVATVSFAFWRISELKVQKRDIDEQILQIETKLEAGGLDDSEIRNLITQLNEYQEQARSLQDSMFYKLGVEGREQAFIENEIRALMAEFGAEEYSIPPEFSEQVGVYVESYRTTDREVVQRALGSRREELEQMRQIFAAMNLPPDLVAMVLVESAFLSQSQSSKGAAGLWQFTPATARAYGLRVNQSADERYDLEKATEAAGSYIRELILDFGSGSSVMLALAAYNSGPGKVKRAVRRVEDPIKQRNFWYLYRVRALPRETRNYVPKIIAAIIIGRNLDEFGF